MTFLAMLNGVVLNALKRGAALQTDGCLLQSVGERIRHGSCFQNVPRMDGKQIHGG